MKSIEIRYRSPQSGIVRSLSFKTVEEAQQKVEYLNSIGGSAFITNTSLKVD